KFQIFIVEDHPLVRQALVNLIKGQLDLSCCGECDSAFQAAFLIAEKRPDLVVADLRLKDGDVFELLGELKTMQAPVPVLVLSHADESIYAEKALAAGARGYLMKHEAPQQLLEAIHSVLQGKPYLSLSMWSHFERVAPGWIRGRPSSH